MMLMTSVNQIPTASDEGCHSHTPPHLPLISPMLQSLGKPSVQQTVPWVRSLSLPHPLYVECLLLQSQSHPWTENCSHPALPPLAQPAHVRAQSGQVAQCLPTADISPLPAPGEPPLPGGPPDVSCTLHGCVPAPRHGLSAKHECGACHRLKGQTHW